MIKALQTAEPGLYLYVDHPGLDTAEMRAVGHIGYEDVAEDPPGDQSSHGCQSVGDHSPA